jgi:flagellar biosynthesis/type III secretory pathway protein FliH
MSALRGLEDFGGGGRRRVDREAQRKLDEAAARARGEGHAAGYAEGFAAATLEVDAEDRAAVRALAESLRDLELEMAGLRAEARDRLRPVVAALVRVAAPQAAAAGLEAAVVAAVDARLAAMPQARLVIRCAADRVEGLALRLGEVAAVRPDPALEGARARLEWEGGGADYDAAGCVAAASAAIDRFFGAADQERTGDVG